MSVNDSENEIVLPSDNELQNAFDDDLFKKYMQEINKYPLATMESNEKYYNEYCQGDLKARENLINTNLRLVVWIAKKYSKRVVNLKPLDIIQEGNFGLMRAINVYNPQRGSFSSCATIYIKYAIIRAIKNKEKIIRQSVNLQGKIGQYLKLIDKYMMGNKPLPDNGELCKLLGVTELGLKYIIKAANLSVLSMNRIVESSTASELGDFIEDPLSNKTDEIIETMRTHEIYVLLREMMSPVEYFIIYYRILDDNKLFLERIASLFDVTRERIRQIEQRTIKKIEKYMANDNEAFNLELGLIRKREGERFYQIKHEPMSVDLIIKYMYVKDSLTLREQEYFKLKYFSKYNYQENEICKFLELETEDYLNFISNLEKKFSDLLADVRKFINFKNQMLMTYGTEIFKIFLNDKSTNHVIDYPYLYKRYATCSWKEIYGIFRDVWEVLSIKEIELLYSFFALPMVRLIQQGIMNGRDVNHIWRILDRLEQKKLELEDYGVYKKVKK